jgi:hypothetical protein
MTCTQLSAKMNISQKQLLKLGKLPSEMRKKAQLLTFSKLAKKAPQVEGIFLLVCVD